MKHGGNKRILLAVAVAALLLAAPNLMAENHTQVGESPSITHRMMMLAIQFGLIIFAAKIAGIAFDRIRLPGVLGELFAGMLLGAYALGGISIPGFPLGLFPMYADSPVSPELYGIATIASIVLLFDVGLETDLKLLFRYFLAGSLVGVGGVAASLISGMLTGYWFAHLIGLSPKSLFDPMCLFLGIASTATSVGITARILSEKRKLDSPEGVTILSAAVIDDVIGIILLAVVTGISAAQHTGDSAMDWGRIGRIGVKAVSVWLVATAVGIMASRYISFALKLFGQRTSIAVTAFGLALILSGLFEEAGLAMIIGAYVMGLSLSKSDIVHVIRERLHTIYALMVPAFFCVTGMFINLKSMADTRVLMFAAIYSAAAFGAKVFGCGLPALGAKFNLLGALRVGVGMVPRGEVGLIIATLGLASGVLDDQLFAAIIIMVVANTVIAPLGLVKLFAVDRSGVTAAVQEKTDNIDLNFRFSSFALVDLLVSKLTEVLEAEGFFTHALSHRDKLFQARKNDHVIEYQRQGATLTVVFGEKQIRLVHTAILDAVASVEMAVKELKSPLHEIDLLGEITSKEQHIRQQSSRKLAQILKPHMVKRDLRAQSGFDVIKELLTFLCDTGQLPRRFFDDVLNEIVVREECMSTGFSGGLAIPHARVGCIADLVCVIGIYPEGIPFDALDGKLSHVFALTLSPESKPTPHLEFIAEITGAFQRCGLQPILNASSTDEVYDLLVRKTE